MSNLKKWTVVASEAAKLDSNVYTGGGTDDTAALQAVLDKAPEMGGLHLIMDGAALVTGLRLHSNTTIVCMNRDCGFFQKAGSNRVLIENYDRDYDVIRNKNITLIGGTYNQNCAQQDRQAPPDEAYDRKKVRLPGWTSDEPLATTLLFRFTGVENLLIRDIFTRNQRTYTMCTANFRYVTIENVTLELPDKYAAQNQDGLHFWGPGRFLTLRDIRGNAGDDIIAVAADEHDGVSDITDVLIDGLVLDEADQAVRLFSRGTGRLDRVTIRNVTGTYKDFGFFINPWFADDQIKGNFGHITIENVDLVQSEHKYHYSVPLLFRLGGEIEKLTLRNIRHVSLTDEHTLLQLGGPYDAEDRRDPRQTTKVGTVLVDNVEWIDNPGGPAVKGIEVKAPVDTLIVRGAVVHNMGDAPFVKVFEEGSVRNLLLSQVIANGAPLLKGEERVQNLCQTDIIE